MEPVDTKTPPGYEEATTAHHNEVIDTRVRLNVGGQKFTTWSSTLAKLPGTRLSLLTWQDPAYDQEEKEYFFDRNPWVFPYVLDAYRHGEVHFPESVCVPAIQAELLHWGLSEQLIPACCWKTFSTWAGDQETSALVEATFKSSSPTGPAGWRSRMNFVWRFLDDARSSKFAAVWLIFYTLLLVLSLVVIIFWSNETFVTYRVLSYPEHETLEDSEHPEHPERTALRDTNIACTFFFLFELLIRFAACPERCSFFRCFFNIIDILHILPMFIYSCMILTIDEESAAHWVNNLAIALLAISTFFRAVCVLKIANLSWKMQVLLLALRASAKELLMFLLLECVFMVAFGSAVYFSERNSEDSHFSSIADGMWWSIVTLTTVGYGDSRPITRWGKLVGVACALPGIVLIALAVSIVANNFRRIYATTEGRERGNQRVIDKKVDMII